MIRLTGPLFSLKAQKQLGHNLIYKRKGNKSLLTKYNKPGGAAPFTTSVEQISKSALYFTIVGFWRALSDAEKKVYNDLVKSRNLKMSGWNYFLREWLEYYLPDESLVGYWNFNKIANGQILDLSGNRNHGTLKPLYPSNYPHLADSKNTKLGKAGSFDGIDDHVDCGRITEVDDIPEISVEMWVNPVDLASGEGLITNVEAAAGFLIDGSGVNEIRLVINRNFGQDASFTPNFGEWNHVVGTFNGNTNTIAIYLNGVLEESRSDHPDSQVNASSLNTLIGLRADQAGYFNGKIDEVRIYNRELPIEEIRKHYDLLS